MTGKSFDGQRLFGNISQRGIRFCNAVTTIGRHRCIPFVLQGQISSRLLPVIGKLFGLIQVSFQFLCNQIAGRLDTIAKYDVRRAVYMKFLAECLDLFGLRRVA